MTAWELVGWAAATCASALLVSFTAQFLILQWCGEPPDDPDDQEDA